jgi:hypothetical protein
MDQRTAILPTATTFRRPEAFRTAIATAFFCPTSTTGRLPRVGLAPEGRLRKPLRKAD